MKKKELIIAGVIICFILGTFFYKVFLKGYILFPGDLLVSNYAPWRFYSYLGYNPGAFPTKFQYFDVLRQLYPWKVFVIDQLKNGQFPLWNPYNFAGSPLLANGQSQVFSPFNLLYFVIPYIYSWNIGLILQIVLAFFFTFLYARKMQVGKEGALLASVAFACSLYMAVFFEYGVFGQTILWLPLILFGIEELLVRLSLKGILSLVLALAFAAFGGHLQVFSYVFILSFVYAFVRLFAVKKAKKMKFTTVLMSFIIALGIASIQLIPSLELIGLAARAPHTKSFFFENILLRINELILFLAPDFYGNPATNSYLLHKSYPETAIYIGIIPLIFALSIIFIRKNNWVMFYFITVIILLCLVITNPLSLIIYSLPISFLLSSSPTNALFIVSFSLSILAGYALDHWLKKESKLPIFISFLLLVILAIAYGLHKGLSLEFSGKNAVYSLGVLGGVFIIFLASQLMHHKKIFAYIFIIFTILDLFYFFQKFNPLVPKTLVFPDARIINTIVQKAGINRVWGYGNANIAANTNSMYHFSSPDGYDPLYPKRYGELVYSAKNGRLFSNFSETTRSDAVFDSRLGAVPNNKYALKLLDLLGVKYIIDRQENGATEKIFPGEIFSPIYEQDGWKIFENKQAVPRVFLTSDYQIATSNQDFEKNFFSDTFNSSKKLLLEERPPFSPQNEESKTDKLVISEYTPNVSTLRVSVNTNKLLFLSDTYYPGWKAYIDGKETKIFRADYDFRAIAIPPGSHLVQFLYKPSSFFSGIIICIMSIVFLSSMLIAVITKKITYV